VKQRSERTQSARRSANVVMMSGTVAGSLFSSAWRSLPSIVRSKSARRGRRKFSMAERRAGSSVWHGRLKRCRRRSASAQRVADALGECEKKASRISSRRRTRSSR